MVVLLLKMKQFTSLVHDVHDSTVLASLQQLGVRWLLSCVEDDPYTHELDILQVL